MNRRQKIIVSVTGIFLVLLLLVGLTYAYFLTRVTGNTNDKSISVKTANLALVYGDGNGILEVGEVLVPGDTVKFKTASGDTVDKKTFTVTNEGNATTDYVVVIDEVKVTYTSTVEVDGVTHTAGSATTFESNDFVYTLTCTSGCNGVDTQTIFPIEGGILVGNSIDVDEEQTYELSMTYLETGENQSNDMNKTLTARVNIKDISTINPYSSNTNTLAYNIINNAKLGATGTTLSATPETIPAASISATTGTGKYELRTDITWEELTYGETQEEADNGANEVSGSTKVEMCNEVKGKYISDAYNCNDTCGPIGYVSDCDASGNPYIEVMTYEKTLSVTQDDYGTSYYYRGNVEDNYIEFNNMCWRIVRIEGDGSIKITLAAQKKCSEIGTSDTGSAFIGTSDYGYIMYETGDYIADYKNSAGRTTSMKYKLEEWYNTNLKNVEGKLKKDRWCLGNTKDIYDPSTGVLLNNAKYDLITSDHVGVLYFYDSYIRLKGRGQTENATLKCNINNYENHESYIGALTADEAVFAGGKAGSLNYNYYLITNAVSDWWWTLSPAGFAGFSENIFFIHYDGTITNTVARANNPGSVHNETYNLRPAVTLASNSVITGGNGTKTNPYIVE